MKRGKRWTPEVVLECCCLTRRKTNYKKGFLVALHPIWIFGNFWKISAFYGIFGKEDNFARSAEIGNFLRGIILLFHFFLDFPEISVDWLFLRKINNISRNFPRTVPYHLSRFQNFQNFWLNGAWFWFFFRVSWTLL